MQPAPPDRKAAIDDQPSLVGPNVDKAVGFFVGVFAPVLGVLTTAAAMFVWAAGGDEDGAIRRRRHAASVTMWSGIGTLVMVAVVLTIIFALLGAAVISPPSTATAPPLP